jgi:hypothetical protein
MVFIVFHAATAAICRRGTRLCPIPSPTPTRYPGGSKFEEDNVNKDYKNNDGDETSSAENNKHKVND